jgi:hypothetical protein
MRRTFDSHKVYDMIEACLATKKIWMVSRHSFLPLGRIRTRPHRTRSSFASMFHLMVKKAGLGRNQYQLTDEAEGVAGVLLAGKSIQRRTQLSNLSTTKC